MFLRWGSDLSSHLSSTSLDPQEVSTVCAQHSKPLATYCQPCGTCVCINCALFGAHQGHQMRDLDDVYREHVATIGEHVTELRAAQARLLEQMQGGCTMP